MTDGEMLWLYSPGGYLDTYRKRKFEGLSAWFNPNSLTNILFQSLVTKKYSITLDSFDNNAIIVHITSEHNIKFFCWDDGLYYFDPSTIQ